MNENELKDRTKSFAIRIINLVNTLPKSQPGVVVANQLLRSGTSVGANYRSACRARSHADFISKLGIVLEEADESLYWMEIIVEANLLEQKRMVEIMLEANELIAIFTTSLKTSKQHYTK